MKGERQQIVKVEGVQAGMESVKVSCGGEKGEETARELRENDTRVRVFEGGSLQVDERYKEKATKMNGKRGAAGEAGSRVPSLDAK